jgi:tetratricopeptide (TPR) repeat protein
LKPMGTITKYYPFIDEESQSILNSLIDESSSYYDFVNRLAKMVLEKDASDTMVYIAEAQCWYAGDLRSAILDKYNSLVTIRPWRYYWGTHESYKFENCQAILQSLNSALEPSKDNWIATELLLAHAYNLSGRPEGEKLLSEATAILDRQPDYSCFKPLAHIAESAIDFREGKISDALTHCRKGYELAKANNDAVYEFLSLLRMGNYTRNSRPQESLNEFEQTYQIAQNLGVPVFAAETLCGVGLAYEILGEYDLAISSQLECLTDCPPVGNEIIFAILSRLYAALGDGQRSLEWADRCLDDREFHLGYLRKARALIILDRLDEAETLLNIGGKKVFQAGYEEHLARYHFVSGLLDMAKGEYDNAMGTLGQAYEILYPLGGLVYLNEALVALATAEVAQLKQSQGRDEVMSGKWLSILENHAHTFDMPGVAMQAALLRSKAFKSQGQLQDARETLQRALELSDSPGVKTLRKKLSTQIQEIDQLMLDEGLVS